MTINKISVLIPVYNEEKTIARVIEEVGKVEFGIEKEIIVIDNNSTDRTFEIAKAFNGIRCYSYDKYQGRSAALNFGASKVDGDIIAFQDGDLEIQPKEYVSLLKKMVNENLKVVFGSRFPENYKKRDINYYGNRFLTWLANIVFRIKLTDVETGCFMINTDLFRSFGMKSKKWDHTIEIVSCLAKRRINIEEVFVDYNPRTKADGKKLNAWIEGFRAIYHIFYYASNSFFHFR